MSEREIIDDIDKYKAAVIARLRSGEATEEEWQEVAQAVLESSENFGYRTRTIDIAVYGPCPHCGDPLINGECECDGYRYQRDLTASPTPPGNEP